MPGALFDVLDVIEGLRCDHGNRGSERIKDSGKHKAANARRG
jgi:hypothetical protein